VRAVFSVLGLLAVLLAIGLLARKQLTATTAPPLSTTGSPTAAPAAAPRQQVEQFKQNLDAAMQQARPIPEEK
jgi:cell division protein FtsB